MKKVAKGTLATGAGVALLLGGGGTLAFWSDSESITGGAINAGHLRIVPVSGDGCDDWLLDSSETPINTTYAMGDPIVPGDVLTRDCEYTVEATGNHLRATVGITSVNFGGPNTNYGGMLTAAVSGVVIGGQPVTEITEANDGDTITANVTVTFNRNATNTTMDMQSVLNSLTLSANQVHQP